MNGSALDYLPLVYIPGDAAPFVDGLAPHNMELAAEHHREERNVQNTSVARDVGVIPTDSTFRTGVVSTDSSDALGEYSIAQAHADFDHAVVGEENQFLAPIIDGFHPP